MLFERIPFKGSLPMPRFGRFALVLLLGCASLSCATDDDFGRCDGTMEITTASGPEPKIQWTPTGCEVYQVTVDQNGAIRWTVTMNQLRNGIASPVSYGVTPPGTHPSTVDPLTLGPYRVLLTRIDDQNRIHTAAQATFSNQ
jgi:hypothetical protein